jgi:aspartokinase-like uncharacterized kinase
MSRLVVKVGGSLFDWPEFPEQLRAFLHSLDSEPILLVPGGGKLAEVIREYDALFQLGEETSHWLAIETLSLQAQILNCLLPEWEIIEQLSELKSRAILNPLPLMRAEERQPNPLPHCWDVTSDSLALRVAQRLGAQRLILLKSVSLPETVSDWSRASELGLVDRHFPNLLRQGSCSVEWVNLRLELEPNDAR